MAEITAREVKEFLSKIPGQVITLEKVRKELQIRAGTKSFDAVRNIMFQLAEGKRPVVKPTARGEYKVIVYASPVTVFGTEKRPLVELKPPIDQETKEPLDFFNDIVFRQGDMIVLSGFKNMGKTALCLNLVAENLDMRPLLMGNEYTIMNQNGFEVSPRLRARLENMTWVNWNDGDGKTRFDLLPVYRDYAEQILPDRLVAIDWVNLPGEYYLVSPVMEDIKRATGSGISIVVLQKNPGTDYGRGGNPSKDFADVELLLDPYGEDKQMVMLTVETVKESRKSVQGRRFVYRIKKGVEIVDFREVIKCSNCWGKGWKFNRPCDECNKTGYRDKPIQTEAND